MDNTEVRPLYRCCCCRYSGSRNSSEPLFLAVYKNDLDGLKSLISCGKSVNGKSARGNTLLNYVIDHRRTEIFDYLLSLDEMDVNSVDDSGRSPIMYATAMAANAYYAHKLVETGADVLLKDEKGMTILHLAARHTISESQMVAKTVIEQGGVVNAINNEEESPLYIACAYGNLDFVHLLLYYDADPTLASKGILPVAAVPVSMIERLRRPVEEVLFEHTFDEEPRVIPLPSMVNFMANDYLFERIMEPTPEVIYNNSDFKYLLDNILELNVKNFQVFVTKFGHIIKAFLNDFPVLSILVTLSQNLYTLPAKDLLDVFLYSDYAFEFVQTANPNTSTISQLASVFSKEETTIISCIMLSYGLNVTSKDLDAVYSHFGHCELFNILLHMDIKMVGERNVIAAIFYDLDVDVWCLPFNINILRFFNRFKLKERYLKEIDEEFVTRIQFLPTVPSLVELSRDQVRKHLIARYNMKNCGKFYTILNWLQIPKVCKQIILYEKCLNII